MEEKRNEKNTPLSSYIQVFPLYMNRSIDYFLSDIKSISYFPFGTNERMHHPTNLFSHSHRICQQSPRSNVLSLLEMALQSLYNFPHPYYNLIDKPHPLGPLPVTIDHAV